MTAGNGPPSSGCVTNVSRCPDGVGMPTTRSFTAADPALFDQAVEPSGILAGDFAGDVGRQVSELLLDVLRGFGPDAVRVGIVGAPHERLHAHIVDQLGADAVKLEGSLALPAPVVAGLHREPEIPETVLPLVVHAV